MRRTLLILSTLSVMLAPTTQARAANAVPTPGRVSALEGKLRLRDPYTRQRNRLTLNSLLRSGDELSTPTGSFAEIELEGGSFVRIAGGTTIAMDVFEASHLVVLLHGSVAATRGAHAVPLSVVALGGRVALDAGAAVRVDFDRNDAFSIIGEVRVTTGRADYVTGVKTDRLDAGQMLTHRPGSTDRSAWDHSNDAFDRWVSERTRWIARRKPPARLSGSRHLGLYDLHDHGRWVVAGGRWGWRPDVAAGWRPYRYGKWSWADPHGWVWVSNASWGYATHHYGRWVHDEYLGWVWIPGGEWGPAWVSWATAGSYIGWAPLGPGGYAVAIHGPPGTYDADCWLLASATYFFFGGGCYSDCQDVIVTVDQATLAGYDPTPVETPSSDLAPPDSSGYDDDSNGGGSILMASMNSMPSPALRRARQALIRAKVRPDRRSNGPRFARGHRRGGSKGDQPGRRSLFDAPSRRRSAARPPSRRRLVTTRPAPESMPSALPPTAHEQPSTRARRPVVEYPSTADLSNPPAPVVSIPSTPPRPSTPSRSYVPSSSGSSRSSSPSRSYGSSRSSSSSSRSYHRSSSSTPSRSHSQASRSRSSSPSRSTPRISAPSSSSNSKKSSAKNNGSSSKPAPKRSSSRSSKRSSKPRRR